MGRNRASGSGHLRLVRARWSRLRALRQMREVRWRDGRFAAIVELDAIALAHLVPHEQCDPSTLRRVEALMERGVELAPVLCVGDFPALPLPPLRHVIAKCLREDRILIGDGHHRVAAAMRLGRSLDVVVISRDLARCSRAGEPCELPLANLPGVLLAPKSTRIEPRTDTGDWWVEGRA